MGWLINTDNNQGLNWDKLEPGCIYRLDGTLREYLCVVDDNGCITLTTHHALIRLGTFNIFIGEDFDEDDTFTYLARMEEFKE